MVGAFHGHAHNQKCQLDWHPVYITGTGHSEGEGCEHIFSASNALARGTRHASTFHRHQTIEQHFTFWNDDKYAALSKLFPTLFLDDEVI
jgi:Kyakuja-Dileera-Zisupton transposase